MYHRINKVIVIALLIYFSILVYPTTSFAVAEKRAFEIFEEGIFDLITFSLEPLNKLDTLNEKIDDEGLYYIALAAKERFNGTLLFLTNLKVPSNVPKDIRKSLEDVKEYLSIGFYNLEESMDYLAQYILNQTPILYDRYLEKRDRGFSYIDGGLITLATARLKFYPPEWIETPKKSIPNAWKVGKEYFYKLEDTIRIKVNK
ncbi:hypothetical protein [Bacillus chungangensis]|uniref:TPM domain-containing protein n=1 Tax=Bacillus chungangensis TaxID=587633 RepID=A0ABT9WM46_9BACI|nr:hypothetical protein [Bacillus chungangensis]MDQ0174228.1 hypothetical protein [Bacillus chungangensis]